MEPKPGFLSNLEVDTGLEDTSVKQAYYQQIFSSTSLEDLTQPLIFNVRLLCIFTLLFTEHLIKCQIE